MRTDRIGRNLTKLLIVLPTSADAGNLLENGRESVLGGRIATPKIEELVI